MAIRVPQYENQVQPKEGVAPSVPTLSTPPPAAFGTTVAESQQRLGGAIQDVGNVIGQHALEMKRQQQESEVLDKDRLFREDLQNLLTDKTPDPNNNNAPHGLLSRNLNQAEGITSEYKEKFNEVRKKYLDSVASPYQKELLSKMLDQTYIAGLDNVAGHEATQFQKAQDATAIGNLNQRINSAPLYSHNPKLLINEINNGQEILYRNLKSKGDDATFPEKGDKFSKDMLLSSMGEYLLDNPSQAQSLFDQTKNAVAPQTQNEIQKVIDDATERFKKRNKRALDISYDTNEASLAGKLANQELTQLELDNSKNVISDDFYHITAQALKNSDVLEGTSKSRAANFVGLMEKYSGINEGDSDQRINSLMKLRKEIISNRTKLDPEAFSQILSWTDPNFVKKITPEKIGWFKAGINFIKDHYDKFMDGGNPSNAITQFVNGTETEKPEDYPALAQIAVKGDTLSQNPELMGKKDISNNVVSKDRGIRQVSDSLSTLTPDRKINVAPRFKPGDEREKGGVVYVRQEDGTWQPKKKIKPVKKSEVK